MYLQGVVTKSASAAEEGPAALGRTSLGKRQLGREDRARGKVAHRRADAVGDVLGLLEEERPQERREGADCERGREGAPSRVRRSGFQLGPTSA